MRKYELLAIYVTSSLLIAAVFISFRYTKSYYNQQVVAAVESILRNEAIQGNSYAVAKSISDLESVGIIKCSTLKEHGNSSQRIFFDTSSKPNCTLNAEPWIFNDLIEAILPAINGQKFEIRSQIPRRISDSCLEILIYFLIGLSTMRVIKNRKKSIAKSIALQKLAEMEKHLLIESAAQIRHDVASPLSAIELVIGLTKDIDPRQKEILQRAVLRTREIFDDLKMSSSSTIENIYINHLIDEIVEEKKLLWRNENVDFKLSLTNHFYAVGNSTSFKRIISNILNNSFEARPVRIPLHIELNVSESKEYIYIMISDNGNGIPEEIVKQLGSKKISYRKEHLGGSGSGIYSAKCELLAWNGDLKIESQTSKGTKVYLKIPRAVSIQS